MARSMSATSMVCSMADMLDGKAHKLGIGVVDELPVAEEADAGSPSSIAVSSIRGASKITRRMTAIRA